MKLRTVRHLARDGFVNVYKQKMMSIATIFIIIASFLVLGIFLFIILNLNELSSVVSKEPEVVVFCKYTLDDGQVYKVEKALNSMPEILTVTKISKEQVLEKIKNDFLKGREDLIQGNYKDSLPVSYVLKLKDSTKGATVIPEIQKIPGVDLVRSPLEIVNMIVSAQAWIRIITIILILILMGISMLIISNAIKLTVHSRKKEITIMQHIGATDAFIKLPFIVEGMTLAVIGSVLAFFLTSLLYNSLPLDSNLLTNGILGQFNFVKMDNLIRVYLLGFGDVNVALWIIVLIGFIIVGLIMGAAGSIISIKKYLELK